MNELFGILKATLEEGFVYAILAYGVYITYSILDFPDLSVDGTVPLGAVLTGVLILQGFNPWLCVLFSFVVGALAGCVTGLLNVKLKSAFAVRHPCDDCVALYQPSAGDERDGRAVARVVLYLSHDLFECARNASAGNDRRLHAAANFVALVIAVVCKYALDWFLSTKSGLLLRAAGNNEQYVTSLRAAPASSKILGLAIGNGFAAMAGRSSHSRRDPLICRWALAWW